MSPRNSAPLSELFPSFDGIAEIRVSEVNNSAEFGGISDVTTISKAGSNQYHGSLFEKHQNSSFAARNTFSAKVPKLTMNDFGGSIGGPISVPGLYKGRDKTFFFVDWESLRLPFQQVLVENVPSWRCGAAIFRSIQPAQFGTSAARRIRTIRFPTAPSVRSPKPS
jgi:hypothetical protein